MEAAADRRRVVVRVGFERGEALELLVIYTRNMRRRTFTTSSMLV
jgi:hypothetical protein